MQAVVSYLPYVIYAFSAIALWRLYSSTHNILWWVVIVFTILVFLSNQAVRNAYNQAIEEMSNSGTTSDAVDAFPIQEQAKRNEVVVFWTWASMTVSAITLFASIIGLIVSFF